MIDAAVLSIFPILVAYAAASDLFTMTIPNRVSILLAAGFVIMATIAGFSLSAFGWHFLAASIVFVACFGMFALGWMGGGDAKISTVIALWFGFTPELQSFVLLAAIYGMVLTLGLLAFRTVPVLPGILSREAWLLRLHDRKTGIPYGIAIAAAALHVYPSSVWFNVITG